MLASFNLIDSMSGYSFYGDPQTSLVPLVGGGLLAVLVAVCVLGGGSRIVRITGLLVPFMGVTYILMALVVMALNFQMLPQVGAVLQRGGRGLRPQRRGGGGRVPPGQAGPGADAVRLYRHSAGVHRHRHDVPVHRHRAL